MSSRHGAQRLRDRGFEDSDHELYEEVEVVQPLQPAGNRYMESTFQSQPSNEMRTSVAAVSRRESKGNFEALLIALTTTLLLCLLVVSLVAVILYSPQVRTSSESTASSHLLSRIEQLERQVEQLQAIQGTNSTLATLTSLQES